MVPRRTRQAMMLASVPIFANSSCTSIFSGTSTDTVFLAAKKYMGPSRVSPALARLSPAGARCGHALIVAIGPWLGLSTVAALAAATTASSARAHGYRRHGRHHRRHRVSSTAELACNAKLKADLLDELQEERETNRRLWELLEAKDAENCAELEELARRLGSAKEARAAVIALLSEADGPWCVAGETTSPAVFCSVEPTVLEERARETLRAVAALLERLQQRTEAGRVEQP
mmetsp:Transcript_14292/g.39555  ORF Transcript_14292/g.39555 Transcript_14292/m.39555 type:complete len:232 (-) Transcript_14292:16-711(-)